ncbi:hypothetical protein [Nannocystis pusilla]|uniref:hypothetical protein n=1 Tax=Nannocystis pusilla TaxID=889268 RepID=UPI003B7BE6E5
MPAQSLPHRSALLAAIGLCACDSHAPATAKAAVPNASPTAAAKPAEAVDDGPTSTRIVKLDLQAVATRRGPIALHRLGDGEVVLAGGLMLARAGVDGKLSQETEWLSGLHAAEPGANWGSTRSAGATTTCG